jgi:hypothetical protein
MCAILYSIIDRCIAVDAGRRQMGVCLGGRWEEEEHIAAGGEDKEVAAATNTT